MHHSLSKSSVWQLLVLVILFDIFFLLNHLASGEYNGQLFLLHSTSILTNHLLFQDNDRLPKLVGMEEPLALEAIKSNKLREVKAELAYNA